MIMNSETLKIIEKYKPAGWIIEPEAKKILTRAKIKIPEFKWATDEEEAVKAGAELGYPLAAKVISEKIIHKSDAGGVRTGLNSPEEIREAFKIFSKLEGFEGVLLEKMVSGVEVIIGAKTDYQFGPVILFGIGGTAVEIYQDVAIRMAPLRRSDVKSMIDSLKGKQILEGYRGSEAVNKEELSRMLIDFANLAVTLEDYAESIDLNPVMCSAKGCVAADARIILKK